MFIADGLSSLLPPWRGAVLALGNFDGFHRGHQAVVGHAAQRAAQHGAPLGVLTFEPHPVRFFKPDSPPFALTTSHQKAVLCEAFGVELMIIMPFDTVLANHSAEAFTTDILVGRLGVAEVVTGDDFTFGKGRGGNPGVLADLGQRHGFATSCVAPVGDSKPFASTSVREALMAGDPLAAAEILGRWWQLSATIEHGDARGRTIGFPTANLALGVYQRPRYGVYAVRLRVGEHIHDGVANIGLRPTFDPPRELLEVHLFDFEGDLYGAEVEVALMAFIREERRFAGLEALKAQIAEDSATARHLLAQPAFAANRFLLANRADFVASLA